MRKLLLLGAALALCAGPAFAQDASVPANSSASAPQAVHATAAKKHVKKHVKKSGKKSHKKGKHSKKSAGKKSATVSKPAPEVGSTAAGESLPPVTDTSGGPQ